MLYSRHCQSFAGQKIELLKDHGQDYRVFDIGMYIQHYFINDIDI